jgi:hypothetical protein
MAYSLCTRVNRLAETGVWLKSHTFGFHKATLISAPNAMVPFGLQSDAAVCLLAPIERYSASMDAMSLAPGALRRLFRAREAALDSFGTVMRPSCLLFEIVFPKILGDTTACRSII